MKGVLHATAVLESAQKVNSGEENSPAAPAGIRTRNLSITSPFFLIFVFPVDSASLFQVVTQTLTRDFMNSFSP